ncbi:MAG TPA: hypothetical protein VKS79_05430 [Gemmataceae bacterium]|nr:hypothetical protein [Gemmataceae bacterium]
MLFPPSNGSDTPTLTPIQSDGLATIKGTVTFDGDPPAMPIVTGVDVHKDKAYCCSEMTGCPHEQTWVVDAATKGVANVVVWVDCPRGKYFPMEAFFKQNAKKIWREKVIIDQPYCMFDPHVDFIFPQYFDGQNMQATGQSFVIRNSAKIPHNINMASRNSILQPGSETPFDLKAKADMTSFPMGCDIHGWMKSYVLSFDHPYVAKTNEKGQFEISNVPAGADLTLKAWQEDLRQKIPAVNGAAGKPIKLKAGQTEEFNFQVNK